ncbi:MAG TPA: hypothetical protein VGH40_03805 [Roseiarcus sp.]|jgi:hypothetical protein
MRKALVAALAVGVAFSCADASAQDNPRCAKFEEPLAYNACLARLGPPAHGVRALPDPEGGASADSAAPFRGGPVVSHMRRGRARLEFDVGQAGGRRQ